MSYEATFTWPYPAASKVIVTGTFDNWSCTFPMNKTNSGFSAKIQVPYNTKILYKFVVDGQWLTGNNAPTEWDRHGNLNNLLITPAAPPSLPAPAPPAPAPEQAVPEARPVPVPEAPIVEPAQVPIPDEVPVATPPVKSATPAVATPAAETAKAPEEPAALPEAPAPAPEPTAVVPTTDVPAVEVVKPVEKPSAEETGTGLGTDAAIAREVLESLEASEEKVVVPEVVVEKPKAEALAAVPEPLPTPAPAAMPEAPAATAIAKPEPAPQEPPASVPVVEEVPAPSATSPKPVVVDLSPPAKIVPESPPVLPIASTFSNTTSSSEAPKTPEKGKSFPLKGSPPPSPSKSLKKDETRKKRNSIIKRIKHIFSHKD